MSPEQAAGKKPDNRSDIFSTGVVMYEMLTGKNPFAGETYTAVITKLIMEQPASVTKLDPIISEDLAKIVERAMDKDVDKRYQDIKDMIEDLQKYLEKVGAIRIDKLLKDYLNNPEGIAQKMRESNISRHLEKGVYYMNLGLEKIDNAIDEFKNVLVLDPENQKAKEYFNELTIKKQSVTELPVIQKTSTAEDTKKTSIQPAIKTEVIPVVDTKKETEEQLKESSTGGKDTIKLDKETIQLQPVAVSVSEAEQPLPTTPSQPTTQAQPTVPQKKKGGGVIVIILIIVILAIVGLVSLLVWLWSEGFIG
jgi:serine/threonine protein kinase